MCARINIKLPQTKISIGKGVSALPSQRQKRRKIYENFEAFGTFLYRSLFDISGILFRGSDKLLPKTASPQYGPFVEALNTLQGHPEVQGLFSEII